MTEQDLFEQRLRAALHRHTADAPVVFDALDFAHAAATRAPRRRGLARVVAWRLAPAPMPAWIIVITVLLLTALVAALLVAGSRPQQELQVVVPPVGQVFTCPPGSTPDKPGPVDQARPGYSETVAFDRRAGRLVIVTTAGSGVDTWTFDVCTNTWTQMRPDREPPSFGWARMAYDIDSDATILISSGRAWAYHLVANTWTDMGVTPAAAVWAYDPLSGFVIAASSYLGPALWSYDVETNTWTLDRRASAATGSGPDSGVFAYDASVDRIVAFGAETWLFDLRAGTWLRSTAETPQIIAGYGWQAPLIVYDGATERTVVFGNGRLAAYDATSDHWEIVEPGNGVYVDGVDTGQDHPSCGNLVAYDPVNERLVCWDRGDPVDQAGVTAFDSQTREWTVLLEPRDRQPAPSSE